MKHFLKRIGTTEFARFIVVGGSSTAIDFTLYMLLSYAVLSPSPAKFISMCCACTFSFFLNRQWTFRDQRRISAAQVLRYAAVQAVNIAVNVGTNALVLWATEGAKIFAFLVATGVAMIVNFLLQKFLVFRAVSRKN